MTPEQRGESIMRDIRLAKESAPASATLGDIAALAIERDLCDRGGLKHVWAEIDGDLRKEILDYWAELIEHICL